MLLVLGPSHSQPYTVGFSGSLQSIWVWTGKNYTTSFPGPPACRGQIVGLLSFHNHLSQSLIVNAHLSVHPSIQPSILLFILFLRRTLTESSSKWQSQNLNPPSCDLRGKALNDYMLKTIPGP